MLDAKAEIITVGSGRSFLSRSSLDRRSSTLVRFGVIKKDLMYAVRRLRPDKGILSIKDALRDGNFTLAARSLSSLIQRYAELQSKMEYKWASASGIEQEHTPYSSVISAFKHVMFTEVGTCGITKRKDLIFDPAFFVRYVQDFRDLLYLLLHERGHILFRHLLPPVSPNAGPAATSPRNYAEDVLINVTPFQQTGSTLPFRFYLDNVLSVPESQYRVHKDFPHFPINPSAPLLLLCPVAAYVQSTQTLNRQDHITRVIGAVSNMLFPEFGDRSQQPNSSISGGLLYNSDSPFLTLFAHGRYINRMYQRLYDSNRISIFTNLHYAVNRIIDWRADFDRFLEQSSQNTQQSCPISAPMICAHGNQTNQPVQKKDTGEETDTGRIDTNAGSVNGGICVILLDSLNVPHDVGITQAEAKAFALPVLPITAVAGSMGGESNICKLSAILSNRLGGAAGPLSYHNMPPAVLSPYDTDTLAMGRMPTDWQHGGSVVYPKTILFLDFSGSMEDYWGVVFGVMNELRYRVDRCYAFADRVAPMDPLDTEVSVGQGTSYEPVVNTVLEEVVDGTNVVLATDMEFSWPYSIEEEYQEKMTNAVLSGCIGRIVILLTVKDKLFHAMEADPTIFCCAIQAYKSRMFGADYSMADETRFVVYAIKSNGALTGPLTHDE